MTKLNQHRAPSGHIHDYEMLFPDKFDEKQGCGPFDFYFRCRCGDTCYSAEEALRRMRAARRRVMGPDLFGWLLFAAGSLALAGLVAWGVVHVLHP